MQARDPRSRACPRRDPLGCRSHLRAVLAACAFLLGACVAAGGPGRGETEVPLTNVGIAPRYVPAFDALRVAVEERDDETAGAILARLQARIALESMSSDETQRVEARSALVLAGGFERVLEGRRRVSALEFALEQRAAPGAAQEIEVWLAVVSKWPTPLTLRSGGGLLVSNRTFMNALGRVTELGRTISVEHLDSLEIPAYGRTAVALGRFTTAVGGDSLACRSTFALGLRATEVVDEGVAYAARGLGIESLERTDLAAFLPNQALHPDMLLEYLERPQAALPPVLERAIRIAPEHREEALARIAVLLERATEEQFTRIQPVLHWLAPDGPATGDRLEWRDWLQSR